MKNKESKNLKLLIHVDYKLIIILMMNLYYIIIKVVKKQTLIRTTLFYKMDKKNFRIIKKIKTINGRMQKMNSL